jgi:hypothetical protein
MRPSIHPRQLNAAFVGGVAVLALMWVAHIPGGAVSVAYLGPAIFVFLLLCLGRYPGARLLVAFSRTGRKRSSTPAFIRPRRAVLDMPRGGSLLGSALAGRAPPLSI